MMKRLLSDWKQFSDEKNLLIYQMGKVGSTSLEETIPGSIHLHSLYANWPCHVFLNQRRKGFTGKLKGHMYDAFRRIAIRKRKKVKIITLVRDVYVRNVSMYFQNLQHWMYDYAGKYRYDNRFENIENLYDAFEKVFDHDYALTWFDDEIKRLTGVDIFEYDFNKKEGWQLIQKGKYEILVIKLEALNDCWQTVENFAGCPLDFKNANISSDKWYNDVYKRFLKEYRPPKEYIAKLYQSKLMRHFYNDEEIKSFVQKASKQ